MKNAYNSAVKPEGKRLLRKPRSIGMILQPILVQSGSDVCTGSLKAISK
jgi:hypothetical protein